MFDWDFILRYARAVLRICVDLFCQSIKGLARENMQTVQMAMSSRIYLLFKVRRRKVTNAWFSHGRNNPPEYFNQD